MDNLSYRGNILKVCKELTQANIVEIKYLLKGDIGEGVLENIKSSLDLFDTLEKLGWISPGKFDFLYKLLEQIDRGDILNLLQGVPAGSNAPNITAPVKVKAKEAISYPVQDIVANHIAGDWKRLARYLEIPETKIENIDLDCRKAYEKATQAIRTWMNSCNASWELLKNALEGLPRYDIIRLVEENFPDINAPPPPPQHPNPPPHGPPRIAQSSSVEVNTQYSTAPMEMDRAGVVQNNEVGAMATTTIAENDKLPGRVETVLTIDRNKPDTSDDYDNHMINA